MHVPLRPVLLGILLGIFTAKLTREVLNVRYLDCMGDYQVKTVEEYSKAVDACLPHSFLIRIFF